MRPHKLTISAFGPYAGDVQLDFNDLKGRSFFLIHGPTGAGKTTILDAFCFALYGDTSGAARDSKTIRSDHAASATPTFVEFDFAVGQACYRIRRSPEQARPKKRGEGYTVQAAEAVLWTLAANSEPKAIAAGWSDVTRKVECLLGFKSSQFRQVVLLPQGEFRKLLTANSSERQEIMQVLFKTDLYRQIEEALKNKASTLKKGYEALQKEQAWVQNEASAASAIDLAAKLAQTAAVQTAVNAELAILAERLKTGQQAVTDGIIAQNKLMEAESAQQQVQEYMNKAALVDQKRVELERARQALGLADTEQMLTQLEEEIAGLQAAAGGYKRQLELAVVRQTVAERQLADEAARESERETAAREVMRLDDFSQKSAALVQARQAALEAEQKEQAAAQARQQVQAQVEQINQQLEERRDLHKRLLETAMHAAGLSAAVQELERIIDRRKVLSDALQQLADNQQMLVQQEKGMQLLEQRYLAEQQQLTALQQLWSEGQAAFMAALLATGQPCPVCGSRQHPSPAVGLTIVADDAAMKEQQMLLQSLNGEREELRGVVASLQSKCGVLQERIDDVHTELGARMQADIADLQDQLEQARRNYQQALDAGRELPAVEANIVGLAERQQQAAARFEQAGIAWQQAVSAVKSCQAVLHERLAAVPPELQTSEALQQAQTTARRHQQQLKRQLETALNEMQQAGRLLAAAQSSCESTQHHLDDRKARQAAAQEAFSLRLNEAGFASRADYGTAKKSRDYLQRLSERIKLFDDGQAAAKERLQRAQTAAVDLTPPDLTALKQVVDKQQQEHNQKLAEKTRLDGLASQQHQWLDKLLTFERQMNTAAEQFGVLGRLAEVANGANEYKLTFQRFVLGALLDDVTIAANERLRMMSRGRYHLQRTMDRARKNAAGGLDLEVFDHYTGIARSVGTLSGGETFLASLSLALGLADVVQAYAGGMHLETILVDEGFGTLDPESLDFALKALLDLQKDGRLVGIISHVPELKERIDARLEVYATRSGSTACFQVG